MKKNSNEKELKKTDSELKYDKDSKSIKPKRIIQVDDEDIFKAYSKLSRAQEWEKTKKPERGKIFPFAFKISEKYIKKLDSIVEDQFKKLPLVKDLEKMFIAEVIYPDISNENYFSIKELLEKAGNIKDPVMLNLIWKCILKNPFYTTAEIEISFVTDLKLETQERNILEFPRSKVDLRVRCPYKDWVDNTFSNLVAILNSARIGGIYKPLLIFRNSNFVHILSYAFGFISYITFLEVSFRFRKSRIPIINIAKKIISRSSIEDKFDAFINEYFMPTTQSPIWEIVLIMAFGIVIWMSMNIFGYWFFPKLVPRSGINIGLSSGRYAEYENTFKLIIFAILLCGIIIPLILKLLF